jgi:hypothetical protein
MGGSDDKSNLVALTAKEHFIIHKLLVEIYPESDSMKRAIWCMSNLNNAMGRNYRVCAAEYERFKILVAEVNSKTMSGEGNPMFGRTPYQIWLEELGKEEADRREKEINKKRSISGKGNKNAKMVRVKCTETDVIYESITEAAKAIGMKHPTLHSWLNNPHRNKTTLVLI